MRVSDFDYHLPADRIAQEPPAERGASRLLHLNRATGAVHHRRFCDLPGLLDAGDLLVVNDTRVFPARLIGRRLPGGGAVECLLVREHATGEWEALVHPGQRLREGSRMEFPAEGPPRLLGEITGRYFHGRRSVRLRTPDGGPVWAAIDAIGHVPLPPYIRRADDARDRERYQTIFAREKGSVAAPTAGLHFTPGVIEALAARHIDRAAVTLHVGYGTFQPVRVDEIEDHRMAPEPYEVPVDAAARISRAMAAGRRIIAVGTTTTRVLESMEATASAGVTSGRGETDLFIRPGHRFRIVSGLVTNFHLPRSSLLMLVCAFGGRERVLAAYDEAVAAGYRFYSYGDAMVIL